MFLNFYFLPAPIHVSESKHRVRVAYNVIDVYNGKRSRTIFIFVIGVLFWFTDVHRRVRSAVIRNPAGPIYKSHAGHSAGVHGPSVIAVVQSCGREHVSE